MLSKLIQSSYLRDDDTRPQFSPTELTFFILDTCKSGIGLVTKKQTAWPFQEGFRMDGNRELHVFTDYRWNDDTVTRCWHVEPETLDHAALSVRPFSLHPNDDTDQ